MELLSFRNRMHSGSEVQSRGEDMIINDHERLLDASADETMERFMHRQNTLKEDRASSVRSNLSTRRRGATRVHPEPIEEVEERHSSTQNVTFRA